MEEISITTAKNVQFIDITEKVNLYLTEKNIMSGFILINIPHTTAGITINENADDDVKKDIIMKLDKIVDEDKQFRHYEGNSKSHIKASLMGFSVTLPVINNKVQLGVWQGIYFCEFDGPRKRKMWFSTWNNC